MTLGPTSRVTINSTWPLLILRLFFQPLYSTLSTVTAALARVPTADVSKISDATKLPSAFTRTMETLSQTTIVSRQFARPPRVPQGPYSACAVALGQGGGGDVQPAPLTPGAPTDSGESTPSQVPAK